MQYESKHGLRLRVAAAIVFMAIAAAGLVANFALFFADPTARPDDAPHMLAAAIFVLGMLGALIMTGLRLWQSRPEKSGRR